MSDARGRIKAKDMSFTNQPSSIDAASDEHAMKPMADSASIPPFPEAVDSPSAHEPKPIAVVQRHPLPELKSPLVIKELLPPISPSSATLDSGEETTSCVIRVANHILEGIFRAKMADKADDPKLDPVLVRSSKLHGPGRDEPKTCPAIIGSERDGPSDEEAKHHQDQGAQAPTSQGEQPDTDEVESQYERLQRMKRELKQKVMGQDAAIDLISDCVMCPLIGIPRRNLPISVLLFVGAKAVGKTEVSRLLAKFLSADNDPPFFELDMAEYAGRSSAQRFVKALSRIPAYDKEVQLKTIVGKAPVVLVLNDIEKANEDVFEIILDIVKKGCLIYGDTVINFENTIVCMHSSYGCEVMYRPGATLDNGQVKERVLNKILDKIEDCIHRDVVMCIRKAVVFNILPLEVRADIAKLKLKPLEIWLSAREITFDATPDALEYLATRRGRRKDGARHIAGSVRRFMDTVRAEYNDQPPPPGHQLYLMVVQGTLVRQIHPSFPTWILREAAIRTQQSNAAGEGSPA